MGAVEAAPETALGRLERPVARNALPALICGPPESVLAWFLAICVPVVCELVVGWLEKLG